jgi:response regulator RpfG family c-di-GMP phosphodiesterase
MESKRRQDKISQETTKRCLQTKRYVYNRSRSDLLSVFFSMNDKKTIMIVEDNPQLSDMYRFKLELAGYHVIVKYDGLAAISSLLNADPDLILLDIMMPGMNGFEVLQTIRAQP